MNFSLLNWILNPVLQTLGILNTKSFIIICMYARPTTLCKSCTPLDNTTWTGIDTFLEWYSWGYCNLCRSKVGYNRRCLVKFGCTIVLVYPKSLFYRLWCSSLGSLRDRWDHRLLEWLSADHGVEVYHVGWLGFR